MMPRTPRSTLTYTLFPYTTLFRSKGQFHTFHLVRPSYAPIFCALSALFLLLSAVSYFHYRAILICVLTSLLLLISGRSEEHTSELQSLMRISYAVFCLKKKISHIHTICTTNHILNTTRTSLT